MGLKDGAVRVAAGGNIALCALPFQFDFDEILPFSLDFGETLRNLANAVASRIADLCVLCVIDRTKSPRWVAASRTNPDLARSVNFDQRPRCLPSIVGVCEVMRTGEPRIYECVTHAGMAGDGEYVPVFQDAGIQSALVVPLKGDREVIGALVMAATKESDRKFFLEDLEQAQGIARRAAIVIEKALQYQETRSAISRLESTLEAGSIGTWEWHIPSGRVTWLSPLAIFTDYEKGKYDGPYDTLFSAIHPSDRRRVERTIALALRDDTRFELEFRIEGTDRQPVWLYARGKVAERDVDGKPAFMRGMCMEMTHRILEERQIREAKQRLEGVVNASPLPIISMDADGQVTDWNQAAERLTGWTREEVVGNFNPMLPKDRDDRDDLLFQRMRSGESLRGIVVRRKKRDGSLLDLSKWTSTLTDEDGEVTGFMAIYADVTDRIRFLDVATHELGNPLSSIKAVVSLLKLYARRGFEPDRLLAQIERLDLEVDRFTNLLNEMITTVKTHEGQLKFEPRPVDVCDVVRASVARAGKEDRMLECNLLEEPAGKATILGDATRLGQVFDNLIGNAIKYSPSESPVRVDVRVEDGHVLVAVVDQGIGIPQSEIPSVFEEFYRGSAEGVSSVGGMGLGLYICREIILRHDGHIWVESEVGVGSTFYVKLPLASKG